MNLSPQRVPLISENWTQYFKWRGIGGFPDAEQTKLRQLGERMHQQGHRLRLCAVPDSLASWREPQSGGVEVIDTDNLA